MIEPVQPRPMMTTSFFGSFCAMATSMIGEPFGAPDDADRRQREGLVVAIDPVEIVVACARKADHFPGRHVAVSAIERISEEALLNELECLGEECLAVGAVEL